MTADVRQRVNGLPSKVLEREHPDYSTGRKTMADPKKLNAISLAKRHLLKAQSEISDAMDLSFGELANAGEMLSLLGRIGRELDALEIQLHKVEEAEK